jgi:uncharacterized protein (TIGR02246 family)
MTDEAVRQAVATAMREMNRAWLEGNADDMERLVHPDVVVILPGFAGRVAGREAFINGFRDFSESATGIQFREDDTQVDVIGGTAVVSFAYEMTYERTGGRYRATGRDVWVFENRDRSWLAVWRTMLNADETAL